MEENCKNATLSNKVNLSDGIEGIEFHYKVEFNLGSRLSNMFESLSELLKEDHVMDF
jgi:hypothetical protein